MLGFRWPIVIWNLIFYRERPNKSKAFFRAGSAGRWREHLSHEQIRRIIADNREQMTRFGYVPEGL